MPILPREQWPECFKKSFAVKGVFVGGCVHRGDGSSFRHMAHAHNDKGDRYEGWICYRSPKRLGEEQLAIHELAHLVSGQGHTPLFWQTIIKLGGSLEHEWLYHHLEERRRKKADKDE